MIARPLAANVMPLEIKGPSQPDVDQAGDAAFHLIRDIGFVDVDAGHQFRGDVLQRDAAGRARENLVAVERGRQVGQPANHDAVYLAVVARDLDAGHALKCVSHGVVGELADVLGDDRVDELK